MRKRLWWIVGILVILVVPIAWYLGSPLFISKTVNEAFPTSGGTAGAAFPMSGDATVPKGMTQQQVEEAMNQASKVSTSATEPMPTRVAAATVVARGTFAGRDDFHRGEGTATLYRVDQALVLRFEGFKVTNGPALYVILTKHPAPKTSADVQEGHVEITTLKGNIGSQNYTLPQGVRPGDFRAVVIYCKQFHVVFATATLQTAQ